MSVCGGGRLLFGVSASESGADSKFSQSHAAAFSTISGMLEVLDFVFGLVFQEAVLQPVKV